jgi:cyclohexanone monooxygenase
MDNFDSVVNGGVEAEDLVADGWTDILRELLTSFAKRTDLTPEQMVAERQLVDFRKMEQVRARCDSIVQDKETAESLKPWYNQFCKRPCFHDEYLQTFNRPNVKLIDTKGNGVDRITEKGVVANGEEYEIDCLIYATGFELATDWTHRTGFEIYGRDGLTITEKWKEGAQTLHGWSTRGFPNCFIVQVVQAALTPNFMHVTGEQARHFAYVIAEAEKRGVRTLEPTDDAEKEWTNIIVEATKLRVEFFKECTPGYYNNEGKPSMSAARNATYGHGSPAFLKILRDWRAEGNLAGLDLKYLPKDESKNEAKDEAKDEVKDEARVENKAEVKDEVREETKEEAKRGESQQTIAVATTATAVRKDTRSVAQKYTDLQAKHHAEVFDLLRRQKAEVERFLAATGQ